MKKTIAIMFLLVFLLNTTLTTYADYDENGFLFSDWIRWGTSINKIEDKLKNKETRYLKHESCEFPKKEYIEIHDFEIKGMSTDAQYYDFGDKGLCAILTVVYTTQTIFLKNSLNNIYGQPKHKNGTDLEAVMILNECFMAYADYDDIIILSEWHMKDNTTIVLADINNMINILYYNLDYWTSQSITDGL